MQVLHCKESKISKSFYGGLMCHKNSPSDTSELSQGNMFRTSEACRVSPGWNWDTGREGKVM